MRTKSEKRVHRADNLVAINAIKIQKRHRKDMGDIASLAASIESIGLLHPIVIRADKTLIAGQRRIEACKRLGMKQIAATVLDFDAIVRAEAAENFDRKDFTLSEAVSIKRELEPRMKAEAKERQGTRTDKHPGKLPTSSRGRADNKVAALTGYSRRTLDKADEIVAAAEKQPKRFGKLLADMERTGRVNGPYKRLKVARQSEAIRREKPQLPGGGPYRVIVADPPWPYEVRQADPSHRGTHPYPQMSIDQICKERVADIAHKDCILWLWTTNHHMREAFTVLDAWGFQAKTILTWGKNRMGLGDWLRGQTEHCILAARGKPTIHMTNQTTLFLAPVTTNSRKPDEFYRFIEKLCPAASYADLWTRERRGDLWHPHGDEVK